MSHARATWRLLRVAAHVVHGAWIAIVVFPRLDTPARHARIAWWSGGLLERVGVEMVVHGRVHEGAALLVANHVSWLDIGAIHAVCPRARFVSKSDVRDWPVLNRLVAAADTLYIERGRRRDALRVGREIEAALRAGDLVAFFPEGTTGEGPEPLPFHGNLLQAAITTQVPVQAMSLRYGEPDAPFSPAAAYVGETTLLQSLWRMARSRGLTVHLEFMPPVAPGDEERRALSNRLRAQIASALEARGRRPGSPTQAAEPASSGAG